MASAAFQILQKSLLDARKDLESTNESIKKLTGFEPKPRNAPRPSSTSDARSAPERERSRRLSGPESRQDRVRPGDPESRQDRVRPGGPESRQDRVRPSGPESRQDRVHPGGPESRQGRVRPGGPESRQDRVRPGGSESHQDRVRPGGTMRAWSGADPESRKRERERPAEGRARLGGRLGSAGDLDLSESKRRDPFGARSRLAGRLGPPVDWEEQERKRDREPDLDSEGEEDGEIVDRGARKPVQSSVVALPAQPRPKADPNEDDKSKKRNQRMFGFLMNTLRKFKDSEATAKASEKERRRSEIEDKVQKTEELEKEAAQIERKELYDQQKAHRMKIATIARQMELVNNYTEWNNHSRKLQGYIETKAKPSIFYLPKEHTPATEELVANTRQKIEDKISKRLKEIDSFIETANSIKSEVPQIEGGSEREVVGGPGEGEGQEPNNGELSGPEQ